MMNIRLGCGEVLSLPTSAIDLSEILVGIHMVETKDQLTQALTRVEWKLAQKALTTLLPTMAADVDQTTRQDLLQAADEAEPPVAAVLRTVHARFEEIFLSTMHRLPKVPDETMRQVVEFLTIPCPHNLRHANMFDHLPVVIQNNKKHRSLRRFLKKDLHPYLPFMNSVEDILSLGAAAVYLGIRPLTYLVGSQFGLMLLTTPEAKVREKYAIPPKFQNAVAGELKQMVGDKDWTALLSV